MDYKITKLVAIVEYWLARLPNTRVKKQELRDDLTILLEEIKGLKK